MIPASFMDADESVRVSKRAFSPDLIYVTFTLDCLVDPERDGEPWGESPKSRDQASSRSSTASTPGGHDSEISFSAAS